MRIELVAKNYRCFTDDDPLRLVLRPGFTAVVGKNNSGKSAVVRLLYELRDLFVQLGDTSQLTNALRQGSSFKVVGHLDPQAFACDLNDRPVTIELRYEPDEPTDFGVPDVISLTIPRGTTQWAAHVSQGGRIATTRSIAHFDRAITLGDVSLDVSLLQRVSGSLANTLYIGAYRNIAGATNEEYYDLHVGNSFVSLWKGLQAGNQKTSRDLVSQVCKHVCRILEFETFEMVGAESLRTMYVTADGRSYDLADMGAGVTQFVIALTHAALKQPSYVLIDEPELNLHPALQTDYLTVLGSLSREGVLFGTHSLGLARSSADWIYSVSRSQKSPARFRPLDATPRLIEFVGSLSFVGQPELGFEQMLLVESISDARVFQQLLRRFKKEHRVLLIPLGGSTLINGTEATAIQLGELRRVTTKVSACIDSERLDSVVLPPERAAFLDLCAGLGIKAIATERRALENYFPQPALDRALGPGHAALAPYAKGVTWPKNRNWRIAEEWKTEDLLQTDVGRFLADL